MSDWKVILQKDLFVFKELQMKSNYQTKNIKKTGKNIESCGRGATPTRLSRLKSPRRGRLKDEHLAAWVVLVDLFLQEHPRFFDALMFLQVM